MFNSLESINNYIKNYFGDNLISLIIFGSYGKEKSFRVTSDVDYFIVLEKMPKTQNSISREIKKHLQPQFPLVAFNIYSKTQYQTIIKNNYWIVLSLAEGNNIVFDKNGFFQKSITSSYKKIKNKKVGELSWYIEKSKYPSKLLEHYRQVSDDFLKSSQIIFKSGETHVALELLLKSIHTFMIGKLLIRNFYITSGEIAQLFFNVYSQPHFQKLKNTFLRLEQSTGQYYSFGFDKRGTMSFGQSRSKTNKQLYLSCLKKFSLIKSYL